MKTDCKLAFAMFVVFTCAALHAPAFGQRMKTYRGTIESVSPGIIKFKDERGKIRTALIQEPDEEAVSLSNGTLIKYPAKVFVTGQTSIDQVRPGETVRLVGRVSKTGKTEGALKEIWLVDGDDSADQLRVLRPASNNNDYAMCEVIGQVSRYSRNRMNVRIPAKNGFTRKTALSFTVDEDAVVRFKSGDYRRAGAGAEMTKLVGMITEGNLVAQEVRIEVTNETSAEESLDDLLEEKYRHLSDQPQDPRPVRSQHFAFVTDVSEREAAIILEKLETMLHLLSAYFGGRPRGMIEGFIVKDLESWPPGMLKVPAGIAKIKEGAGLCVRMRLGRQLRAELYSAADHGVIQHECVHGICHMMFGSTGPTWLAEGVAELGQYWKADQKAVDIDPVVMNYLKHEKTKPPLEEIAVPGRTEAGTWKDYAWRWALCHMLANNPNYSRQFKPLAVGLMSQQPGASFEAVYGNVQDRIAFEYDQFQKNVDNGYRADLCAWQWASARPLQQKRTLKVPVKAAYGWQASGIEFVKGQSYDLAAAGKWKIAKETEAVGGAGDKEGRGKLVAAIFGDDLQLSEPIEIGKKKRFRAASDGQLYLRCQDEWNQLADNEGELTVHVRITPKK